METNINTTSCLSDLLRRVGKIAEIERTKKAEKNKREANFNVFNVIGLWSEEVRLHSAFIAELLNTHESHGMGNTFLKAFFYIHLKRLAMMHLTD